MSFYGAKLPTGLLDFRGAEFSGGTVDFLDAEFSGGEQISAGLHSQVVTLSSDALPFLVVQLNFSTLSF